jgi:pentatricopeptide repeat protein
MYIKFGEEESARTIFDQLNHKDLIAWSAMISAYGQGRNPHNALDTFKQMQSMNEKPHEINFVSLYSTTSMFFNGISRAWAKHPRSCNKSWLLTECII